MWAFFRHSQRPPLGNDGITEWMKVDKVFRLSEFCSEHASFLSRQHQERSMAMDIKQSGLRGLVGPAVHMECDAGVSQRIAGEFDTFTLQRLSLIHI